MNSQVDIINGVDPELKKEWKNIIECKQRPPHHTYPRDAISLALWDICLYRSFQPETNLAIYRRNTALMQQLRRDHAEIFAKYEKKNH